MRAQVVSTPILPESQLFSTISLFLIEIKEFKKNKNIFMFE